MTHDRGSPPQSTAGSRGSAGAAPIARPHAPSSGAHGPARRRHRARRRRWPPGAARCSRCCCWPRSAPSCRRRRRTTRGRGSSGDGRFCTSTCRPSTAPRGSRCRCCSHRLRAGRRPGAPTCGCTRRGVGALAGVVFAFRVGRRLAGPGGRRGGLRLRPVDGAQRGLRQLRGAARGARAGGGRPPRRGRPARPSARPGRCAAAPGGVAARSRSTPHGWRGARRAPRDWWPPARTLPALWLLPELWGSGDLLRAMHRATASQQPGLRRRPRARGPRAVRDMLTLAVGGRRRALVAVASPCAERAARGAAARRGAAGFAVGGSVAEVAVMTSDGFSGQHALPDPARRDRCWSSSARRSAGAGGGAARAQRGGPRWRPSPRRPQSWRWRCRGAVDAVVPRRALGDQDTARVQLDEAGLAAVRPRRRMASGCALLRRALHQAVLVPSSPGTSGCTPASVRLDPDRPAVVLPRGTCPGGPRRAGARAVGQARPLRTLAACADWRSSSALPGWPKVSGGSTRR